MYINASGEKIIYKSFIKNSFLNFEICGTTNPNPHYEIIHNQGSDHSYPFYVIEYVESGVGYIEVDDKKYTVSKGNAYFLNKFLSCHYYADKISPFKKTFIVFSGRFADNIISLYKLDSTPLIIQKLDILPNLNEILAVIDKDKQFSDIDLLSTLLLKIIQKLKPNDFYSEKEYDTADMIKSILDGNLTEKINLDDIAKIMSVSKSNIERIFFNKFNTTPIQYFNEMKLKYACNLLSETNFSISFIANSLSFLDPKYFSKCIKKATGLSPKDYRKKSRLQK